MSRSVMGQETLREDQALDRTGTGPTLGVGQLPDILVDSQAHPAIISQASSSWCLTGLLCAKELKSIITV